VGSQIQVRTNIAMIAANHSLQSPAPFAAL